VEEAEPAVQPQAGPWGYYYAAQPEVERAHVRIESLSELPEQLNKLSE
jgi:hypothetical protein